MGYCKSCLKAKKEVPETVGETARLWFIRNFCKKELIDYRHDFYTQGVAKGYEMGFEEGVNYITEKHKELSRDEIDEIRFPKINGKYNDYDKVDKKQAG